MIKYIKWLSFFIVSLVVVLIAGHFIPSVNRRYVRFALWSGDKMAALDIRIMAKVASVMHGYALGNCRDILSGMGTGDPTQAEVEMLAMDASVGLEIDRQIIEN